MEGLRRWLRDVVPPVALIVAIDAVVTLIFFGLSAGPARVGTLRPLGTIPPKVLELVLVGAGVGLAASVGARRLDFTLLALAMAFVALLDIDHLPSFFGIGQPIRPAHSFAFLAVEVSALGLAFRKRPELALLAVSAFFGHVAGDSGIFALFAPFSFDYSSIDAYKVPFGMVAVVFALAAGYVGRHRIRSTITSYSS
jgi:hypothetical protein